MHPGEVNIRNVAPASFLAGIEHCKAVMAQGCWSVVPVCATSYSWKTGPHWGSMESPQTAAGTRDPATPRCSKVRGRLRRPRTRGQASTKVRRSYNSPRRREPRAFERRANRRLTPTARQYVRSRLHHRDTGCAFSLPVVARSQVSQGLANDQRDDGNEDCQCDPQRACDLWLLPLPLPLPLPLSVARLPLPLLVMRRRLRRRRRQ